MLFHISLIGISLTLETKHVFYVQSRFQYSWFLYVFMKVFSVTFNHEHQDCTACYTKTITPYCSSDYVTVHTVLRVTCNTNSTCINYKPYFTHPTLSACSRCTQHSSVRNPSATSSFTATNSKFFLLFYMKNKLIEKYEIHTFMCILILNLTILYRYFHFSIQFFLKHTNQISHKAKNTQRNCFPLLMKYKTSLNIALLE
jgi:hypothetical protein